MEEPQYHILLVLNFVLQLWLETPLSLQLTLPSPKSGPFVPVSCGMTQSFIITSTQHSLSRIPACTRSILRSIVPSFTLVVTSISSPLRIKVLRISTGNVNATSFQLRSPPPYLARRTEQITVEMQVLGLW